MHTRTVPCLVRDNTGGTKITLEKSGGVYMRPRWACPDWTCPKRGGENPYKDFSVRLGTVDTTHGVIRCEGVGGIERRHSG